MIQFARRTHLRILFAIGALSWTGFLWAADAPSDAIRVKVDTDGELVVVDVEFEVAASARDAWRVLTDFDGMPKFLTGVERSRVVARSGNTWRVAQQGVSSAGPLSFSYDMVREVKLKPYSEIKARALSGSMKKLDSSTRLASAKGVTRITYHAESIPATALPLGIGTSFIEARMRDQFGELRKEILRRAAAGKR